MKQVLRCGTSTQISRQAGRVVPLHRDVFRRRPLGGDVQHFIQQRPHVGRLPCQIQRLPVSQEAPDHVVEAANLLP